MFHADLLAHILFSNNYLLLTDNKTLSLPTVNDAAVFQLSIYLKIALLFYHCYLNNALMNCTQLRDTT